MTDKSVKKRDWLFGSLIVAGLGFMLLARPVVFTPQPAKVELAQLPDNVKTQLRQPSQTPVHGIDVSHYQGSIDWPAVAAANIDFAYVKATDGITYTDPAFDTNVASAAGTQLKLGAYHFFEADDDPQQQLANFLNAIKGKPLSLVPMVDVEVTDNQPASQIKRRLTQFLQQLEQATGCTPLIYSYRSFWQTNIGPDFNRYPFWLADYAAKPSPPEGVKNWQIWQYSEQGKVAGIEHPVDMDVVLDGAPRLAQLACDYQAAR